MLTQRWLSLTGICTTLQLTPDHVKNLVKKGFLVKLPALRKQDVRYLDPTPEYANKLRMGEALYGRLHPLPIDINLTSLLTLREVAAIMGWQLETARQQFYERKIPFVKAGKYNLYSVVAVRDLLWRREKRRQASQRAPFLIQHIIDWFLKHQAAEAKLYPTDHEFMDDDLIQEKLARMAKLPSPQRELAMREFYEKVRLAKIVAASLQAEPEAP